MKTPRLQSKCSKTKCSKCNLVEHAKSVKVSIKRDWGAWNIWSFEPLELRRLKSDLVLYYKCLHDLVALPSSERFTISNCTSQTQTGGNTLLRPLYSTKLYENDFFNRCVSCWNYLPTAVVNASSISCFKRLLSNVDLSPFTHCTYF